MVQNYPLASGKRKGFRTFVLLAAPEEIEREEALQLEKMKLPGGNRRKTREIIMAEDSG